jgi:hypothetical protein
LASEGASAGDGCPWINWGTLDRRGGRFNRYWNIFGKIHGGCFFRSKNTLEIRSGCIYAAGEMGQAQKRNLRMSAISDSNKPLKESLGISGMTCK